MYLFKVRKLSLILLLVFSSQLLGVLPHPELMEKIKNNEISEPYYLSHIEDNYAKGINTFWKSEKLLPSKSMSRIVGPEKTPTGSWNALMILVQFSDQTSSVSATEFDTKMFDPAAGTLRNYYSKVSYGNLDIVTVNLPSAIGWVDAPQTYAYYVNGQNGTGSYPNNSQRMTEDAVNAVDAIVDFSNYDNDGDGDVDALFIVHTGPGAEYTGSNNDIWSHAWVTSYTMSVDGVNVWRYSTAPEYWSTPGDMTIGVYAHELGHAAFGLPDVYDRDYSSSGLS